MFYQFVSNPASLPVIAILAGCSVAAIGVIMSALVKITKIVVAHRERMAKLEQGIDPDRVEEGHSRETTSTP